MGAISDARNNLKTALAGAGYVIYPYPAENMTPPCIVFVPAAPYIEIKSIGTNPRLNGSFLVTLCVAMNDNQAALTNLETMMTNLLANLPQGVGVGDFSQPKTMQVGPTDLLTTDVVVDVTI